MSNIIRAKVTTNSSEDEFARVKLTLPGLWSESELVESVGAIPLKVGDWVFVDVSEVANPLIIGRAAFTENKYAKPIEGSLLFESSDGTNWTIAYVKNDKLEIATSKGVSIVLDGKKLSLQGGTSTPTGKGSFCAIPYCPFTGAPQTSEDVIFT